jgi:hypothetical protein
MQLLPGGALACVLLALAAGAPRGRWLPVAAFLAIAALANGYFWLGGRLQRRRTQRVRQTEVAFGVRHTQPLWMTLILPSLALAMGALLAALVAAVGFAGVAAGVLLIFAGIAVFVPFATFGMAPRGLTFEADGLRIHIGGGGSFVVPWTAIAHIDGIGPDHSQILHLRLIDADAIIASHEPNDPRVRVRVESFVQRSGDGARLTMMPWTAGLDGPTIARTIYAAKHGTADRTN